MSASVAARRLYVEEYRIWKRNTPFLYDYVVSKALEWPSLTCEWIPGRQSVPGTDYLVQNLILGTHTTGGEQNFLMVAEVRTPAVSTSEISEANPDAHPLKSKLDEVEKVNVVQKINHEGEVNRARSMPKNYQLIATKSPTGQVLVFDTSRHMLKPSIAGTCTPQLRLGGHEKEGYGLSWNQRVDGQLLSGSDDSLICMWDILAKKVVDVVEPLGIFSAHKSAVQDVCWHNTQPQIFGSVGDDKKFMLWDVRTPDRSKPMHSVQAHDKEVNCLAFNPEVESLVVTGSSDKTIALWDIRCLDRSLHVLEGHEGDIFQVAFSPNSGGVLASASADRRVVVWNLGKIGKKPSAGDDEKVPPELMFVHAGHTGKLNDISWNVEDPWFLASVAEDNIVQVWCPGEHVTNEDGVQTTTGNAEPMEQVEVGGPDAPKSGGDTTDASNEPAAKTEG